MIQLINMPLAEDVLREYENNTELRKMCKKYGCKGIEAIWGGEQCSFNVDTTLIRGWHLGFYCDWLDFWKKDGIALLHKFKSKEVWELFYGGADREALVKLLSEDLERADRAGAEYVVFHVSDVSIEECYTYKWLHTDEEVIDASAELINLLLDNKNYKFKFLMENLHWAGFNFTRPDMTKRLLQKVHYQNKGIMLDIGHLMCTNTNLKTEKQAVKYIHQKLDEHGILCRYIKGVHLHQSLSGEYVREHTCIVPELPNDYFEKFSVCYKHVLNIDKHQPIREPDMRTIIERINPDYLVHELAASDRRKKEEVLSIQTDTLRRGETTCV
ncbi:MAG: AP endonuclease [Clostridiales bacterium]|nr:AP endonuclease [Clostridiales bacterium]